MTRNNRLPKGDDGHVIADMNVDGMPWYAPEEDKPFPGYTPGSLLDKRQTRFAMWGALKAALLVTAGFSAGIILFVLFCVHVWFKV